MDSLPFDLIAGHRIPQAGVADSSTNTSFLNCLLDSLERCFPPQHLQRLKQRRGILSPTDGHADGLKHLSRLYSESLSGGAQSLIQRIVFELGFRQHLARSL